MKKRIIFKIWDSTNGRLYARYYRVSKDYMIVRQFQSAILLPDPGAAKGTMRAVGKPLYLGRGFIQQAAEVFEKFDEAATLEWVAQQKGAKT